MASFKEKQKNAASRKIGFFFTPEQYAAFVKLIPNVRCFYTNAVFVEKGDNAPTLERIDEKGPYSVENCVWVTAKANRLKEQFIEKNENVSRLNPSDAGLVRCIKKVLSSESMQEKRRLPYVEAIVKLPNPNQAVMTKAEREIIYAKSFVEIGDQFTRSGKGFDITMAQFKKLVNRKYCQVSHIAMTPKSAKLFVKDTQKAITPDNVVVCSIAVRDSLNALREATGLDGDKLFMMFERLVSFKG